MKGISNEYPLLGSWKEAAPFFQTMCHKNKERAGKRTDLRQSGCNHHRKVTVQKLMNDLFQHFKPYRKEAKYGLYC